MKTLSRMSIAGAALAAAISAHAATWKIDAAHSVISFSVTHMALATVRGSFDKFEGTVIWDEKNPDTFSVEASADAASVNTHVEKRDADLRSARFFDAEKFPNLTFKSKSVKEIEDGRYTMTGDLTMHGITREVTFDVIGFNGTSKDPWGGTRTAATATATINRQDFGLTWNQILEGGGLLVSNYVNITLDVELVKQAEG